MADVFISYASVDRTAAERIARALEKSGLSVWWDRHIKGGSEFSRDIEEQLETAAKVLVLWSKEAVNSRWVRDEASVAIDTHRLVAATIDGTPAPLGFRQFQTLDLKRLAARGGALPPGLVEALGGGPAEHAPRSTSSGRRPWLVVAALAAVLVVAAGLWIVRPGPFERLLSGQQKDDAVALAIMPFVAQDRDIEYLGAGLSSALADSLAPLSGLKITASTSSQALAGKGLTASDIARKLGVTHLVEGNVQSLGQRLGISIRLVEASTSAQIWARSFEGEAAQLQQLKSRMARELAGALRARLMVGEGEIADRRNVDPRAYEAYLKGLERMSVRERREARLEAIKQFRLAASIDPQFAEAHAGHAYLLSLSTPEQLGTSWDGLKAEQRRALARALALDPDNDLALVARSTALKNFDGDVERSIEIDRAVLARSPNFGPAHYSLAASLWMRGRGREALDQLDLAIERDPFDGPLQFYRTKILFSLGDYQGVRRAILDCQDGCGGLEYLWFMAMAAYASPAQIKADAPMLEQRARAEGVSSADWADSLGIINALASGRPYSPRPYGPDDFIEFFDSAIAARLISFEEGLRLARKAADFHQADYVLDILNEGRLTFTPEQRADPRYHQLFKHPKLVKIEAARRKEGVTAGLPVFPVKAYAGR